MRPKVKFLAVVWGKTYIARFASLALPSFLAPGNLPALAEATDLEVVVMTRRDDIAHFENHAAFRRLRAICPVQFVEIDDLIATSIYGVTLTLAYIRPIIACGRDMLNTHFVFMNADFVLADGSLRALSKHILAGRSIVLGPSFRATAEAVEPHLERMVDTDSGVLAVPPRQMVALSLAHPHPTTMAKIVNQTFCHSIHPNQFFWQVDKQTLLGRYYLIFMLCLKPERVIGTINCYCDYSFIPEMCPSGDETAMNDSDDFFMLELQERTQETSLLQLGRAPDNVIARSLQYWTTAEHRRAAGHDIIFHSGEIPAEIEAAKLEAQAFVNRIRKKLGRPVPHVNHIYWVHGVRAWLRDRAKQGLTTLPAELTVGQSRIQDRFSFGSILGALSGIRWRLISSPRLQMILEWAKKTPLHPYWLDYRLLRGSIAKIMSIPGARLLVVRDKPEPVDRFIGADETIQFASVQSVLKNGPPVPQPISKDYTHVLICLQRRDLRNVQALINQCQSAMDPGGTYQVFIHDWLGETRNRNFSHELVRHLENIIGWPPQGAVCLFVGGSLKRFNIGLLLQIYRYYSQPGKWALRLLLAPPLAVSLIFVLLGNLYLCFKQPSSSYVDYCSSVAIQFDPYK